jgi:hypothetical protein
MNDTPTQAPDPHSSHDDTPPGAPADDALSPDQLEAAFWNAFWDAYEDEACNAVRARRRRPAP